MTAVIHCLRTWRHYLLGSHLTVYTDNVATSYFQSQKRLTPTRWQDFLAEFDYTLEYRPGKVNVVADALSRQRNLAPMQAQTSSPTIRPLNERIKAGLTREKMAQGIMKQIETGHTRRFWMADGLLYTSKDCTSQWATIFEGNSTGNTTTPCGQDTQG